MKTKTILRTITRPTLKTSLMVCSYMLLSLHFVGCRERIPEEVKSDVLFQNVTLLPESELIRALLPCSRNPTRGSITTWTPTANDVVSIEKRLENYLATRLDPPLQEYYRQYIGLTIDGDRVLYIHAFKPPPNGLPIEQTLPTWRTKYVWICDGGQDSWGLRYHLKNQKFTNFEINATFGK